MPVEEKPQLEDYQRLSALFQFYLELVLKAFTFALGIAGGVSAFVLGKDVPDRRLAACCFPQCYASGWELHSYAPRLRVANLMRPCKRSRRHSSSALHPMPAILPRRSIGSDSSSSHAASVSRFFGSLYFGDSAESEPPLLVEKGGQSELAFVMNEKEFQDASKHLMYVLNTQGLDAAAGERDSLNQALQAHNQRIDFQGAMHLGLFSLCDTRTNAKLYEFRLGSIMNWPKTS
jgi:hypothetical protein